MGERDVDSVKSFDRPSAPNDVLGHDMLEPLEVSQVESLHNDESTVKLIVRIEGLLRRLRNLEPGFESSPGVQNRIRNRMFASRTSESENNQDNG